MSITSGETLPHTKAAAERLRDSRGRSAVILTSGTTGAGFRVVEVPKDPSKTHPYRQKDVLGRMNAVLTGLKINQFDVKCVNVIYGIKKRPELYYQGTVPGSPVQYSDEFIQWLTSQIRNDPDFFLKTRRKYQEGQSSRSAVPASQAGSAKGNGQGSNGRSGGLVSGGTETGVRRLGDAKPA